MAGLTVCSNAKRLYGRLQEFLGLRKKREVVISAPFNFRKEEALLPGVSKPEMTVLKDQAAASCIRVADEVRPIPRGLSQPPIPPRGSSLAAGSPTSIHTVSPITPSPSEIMHFSMPVSPVSVRSRAI